jgi:hypothetical protein
MGALSVIIRRLFLKATMREMDGGGNTKSLFGRLTFLQLIFISCFGNSQDAIIVFTHDEWVLESKVKGRSLPRLNGRF